MKIIYRPHLIRRLKERKVPKDYPKQIVKEPESTYFDTITKHKIAIKRLTYGGKLKSMVVSYDIIEEIIELITIHPIKESEIKNKIISGRWRKNEKN